MIAKISSRLIYRHSGTDYATMIRGLAALAVLGVHGGGIYPFLQLASKIGFGEELAKNFSNLGNAGPAAFFITSGFVLSLVWEKQCLSGYRKYAIRRYLRLTPLYLVVLMYCLVVFPEFTLSDLFFRLLYLDAFNESLFLRAPIGILWTIAIEFWLSLCIPLFIIIFRKIGHPEMVLLCAFLVSALGPVVLISFGLGDLMAWKSIPSSVFCFILGSYLSTIQKSRESAKVFKLILVFSLGFMCMYLWNGFMGAWWLIILLTASYLGYRRSRLEVTGTPSFLIWLGTICYGVYLLHPIVLAHIGSQSASWAFYIALIPVLLLASFSWVFIEKPFSGLFRKVR